MLLWCYSASRVVIFCKWSGAIVVPAGPTCSPSTDPALTFKHWVMELLIKICSLPEMKFAFTHVFLLVHWCLSMGVLRGIDD